MLRLLGLILVAVSVSPVHLAPRDSEICAAVKCAAPNCTHPIKPGGQCCDLCPGNPCEDVICRRPQCSHPYKSDAGCCLECPITDCSNIICIALNCANFYKPKGQCCPICRKDKPGKCPKIEKDEFGICIEACSADKDCAGNRKCCSNGCGHTCQTPVNCKAVKCENLDCTNNYIPEGQCCPICREDKPGKCPATVIGTSFGEKNCSWDQDCPGHEKCCSSDCGSICQEPDCANGQNGICGGIQGLTCTTGTTCMFTPKGVADGAGKCCNDNPNVLDSA